MFQIDAAFLREVAPQVSGQKAKTQGRIVSAVGAAFMPVAEHDAIDTRLRIAHFVAQTCHESDGFCTLEEYASGNAYEGRADLGNTHPGDGPRFKGRGLIQLTGRANYSVYGTALGLDLLGDPDQAAQPETALRIAGEFWTRHGLNALADADDLITITRRINGGLNGLDSRRAYLSRAKAALAALQAEAVPTADNTTAPLHRGSTGTSVADLQKRLRTAGYQLAVDGDFGPATELAVSHFQAAHGLPADGIAGAAVLAALPAAA